jgi:hypothetical protein
MRPEVLDALAVQIRDAEITDHDVTGPAAPEDAAGAEPHASAESPAPRAPQHLGLLVWTNRLPPHARSLRSWRETSAAPMCGNDTPTG